LSLMEDKKKVRPDKKRKKTTPVLTGGVKEEKKKKTPRLRPREKEVTSICAWWGKRGEGFLFRGGPGGRRKKGPSQTWSTERKRGKKKKKATSGLEILQKEKKKKERKGKIAEPSAGHRKKRKRGGKGGKTKGGGRKKKRKRPSIDGGKGRNRPTAMAEKGKKQFGRHRGEKDVFWIPEKGKCYDLPPRRPQGKKGKGTLVS